MRDRKLLKISDFERISSMRRRDGGDNRLLKSSSTRPANRTILTVLIAVLLIGVVHNTATITITNVSVDTTATATAMPDQVMESVAYLEFAPEAQEIFASLTTRTTKEDGLKLFSKEGAMKAKGKRPTAETAYTLVLKDPLKLFIGEYKSNPILSEYNLIVNGEVALGEAKTINGTPTNFMCALSWPNSVYIYFGLFDQKIARLDTTDTSLIPVNYVSGPSGIIYTVRQLMDQLVLTSYASRVDIVSRTTFTVTKFFTTPDCGSIAIFDNLKDEQYFSKCNGD